MTINQVLEKYIFRRFKLSHTTLDKNTLQSWTKDCRVTVAQGYRVCENLEKVVPVPENYQYIDDSLLAGFLGAWSTTADIVKLFDQLFATFHGWKDAPISQEACKAFFGKDISNSANGEPYYPAGTQVSLASDRAAQESPNRLLVDDWKPICTLDYKRKGKPMQMFYKGASISGFAGTLHVEPETRLCVVTLSSIAGPIDPTPHAAHILLQDILDLKPHVNIPLAIENNLGALLAIPRRIEWEGSEALLWPSHDFNQFVGIYWNYQSQILMKVNKEGLVSFQRGAKKSIPIPARSFQSVMRLISGGSLSTIDRLKGWRCLDFHLRDDGRRGPILITGDGREIYTKGD